MTEQIILTVPEAISARARQIAAETDLPVEQVLLYHLQSLPTSFPLLPPEVQDELDALQHLSDDALWTIAREQMPRHEQIRATELMDKNTRGPISVAEQTELTDFSERGDRLILRKAEAGVILRRRGYAFTPKDYKL